MARRKKRKFKKITIILFVILLIVIVYCFFLKDNKNEIKIDNIKKDKTLISFIDKDIEEVNNYSKNNNIILNISYDYSDTIEKDKVISQSIEEGTKLSSNIEIDIVVSLGKLDKDKLASDDINEMGKVPVMMYHGIVDKPSSETAYVGGNVDRDGYNRTAEAFREDLEFYYQEGFRMIRLIDYVNGDIATEYGKSPIVLTFDDGNINNFHVTGIDSSGELIIDPNCAVGILEEFKKKYPDYNVTATFFVNDYLFQQSEYNEKILNWLVDNGYDIGNHTEGHANMAKTSIQETQKVISVVYKKLDEIIPNKYVHIIALPYGNPTNSDHPNYPYVIDGTYDGYTYHTDAALRVGWEPEVSSYDKNFDKNYIKRCRAYDANGKEFDIEMVFNMLKTTKYISDGNKDTIVTSNLNSGSIIDTTKKIILY